MANLLEETIEILKRHELTPDDVLWVGNRDVKTDWKNFEAIANVEYVSRIWSQKVATDLLIVGKYWWLERHKHDGSEWWEFKKIPKTPDRKIELVKVIDGSWNTLKDMNDYKLAIRELI